MRLSIASSTHHVKSTDDFTQRIDNIWPVYDIILYQLTTLNTCAGNTVIALACWSSRVAGVLRVAHFLLVMASKRVLVCIGVRRPLVFSSSKNIPDVEILTAKVREVFSDVPEVSEATASLLVQVGIHLRLFRSIIYPFKNLLFFV